MAGLNRVMLIGGLGRDPEVTYTQSGKSVCKLSIATSETWTDKQSGEKRESTEWHRAVAFDKQAETLGQYLTKGSQVYIEGQLKTSKYTKDGIDRYSTDIIVKSFQFIGSKQQNTGQPHPQADRDWETKNQNNKSWTQTNTSD